MTTNQPRYVLSEYRDPKPNPGCDHSETFRAGRQGGYVAIICSKCRGVLGEQREPPGEPDDLLGP